MRRAEFETELPENAAQRFADLSGDWNALHTDATYAATTRYRKPILHGAYAAALVSRMAGMHLPGAACLLHGMRLRFVSPIYLPAIVKVKGEMTRESRDGGEVTFSVFSPETGLVYSEGSYEFGLHETSELEKPSTERPSQDSQTEGSCVLITGAGGALGKALTARLGGSAFSVSRAEFDAAASATGRQRLVEKLGSRRIAAAVHCGWPPPDNQRLIRHPALESGVNTYVLQPLLQAIGLARLLADHGTKGATLVVVGSTAAEPGRHAYKSPLYSIGKSMLDPLLNTLAIELALTGQRCVAINFDAMPGGMNSGLSKAALIAHADRSPWGELLSPDEAAAQIGWILGNPSRFLSGATIRMTGGALP